MNWKFWQKQQEPQPEPRRLHIPEKDVYRVLRAIDKHKETRAHADRYLLWELITDIFPEVKEGDWHYHVKGAFTVDVIEGLANVV